MKEGEIIQLSIGQPKKHIWKGKEEKSAIGKSGVKEALLTRAGFIGDGVGNPEFHGGADRAVCLYSYNHYPLWEQMTGEKMNPPAFGENITVGGMVESNVFIGDVFQVGNAVLQISQGRIPCSTISKHNDVDTLLKRVVETGFTGYFFRVVEEGTIREGDRLVLLEREQEVISILKAHRLLFHEQKHYRDIETALGIDTLAEAWKERLGRLLS
ncbi:MOSC domain-containing protein [Mesobacillus zeae]|uniref:MOSC domain-containing protein n=1 Tax=Mesobacillus zeae TaxID=1917180 RepID=A0A398B6V5_9BACI|nr:MOSC domain-containing protein [Mesobacillus zeae]RID85572.1 MOSC domain-containing protein [Mesobacillus zeae]